VELNHFHDPTITFSAQYGGPDGPKIVAQDRPFTSVYLMERESRGPQTRHDCAVHLASYLIQDMTTPLGKDLDVLREIPQPPNHTPFRSFGAAGIWFPRGLMLRSAARIMCQRILMEWQDPGPLQSCAPVEDLCSKMQATPALQPDAITNRLEKTACGAQGTFQEGLGALLNEFESDVENALEDAPTWAKKVMDRLTNWVGTSGLEDGTASYLHSRVTRVLNQAVQDLGNEFAARLSDYAIRLMERPGKRIAATESALNRMAKSCAQMAELVTRRIPAASQEVADTWANLKAAHEVIAHGSGFRLFGSRTARNLRSLIADMATYGKAKIREQLVCATARLYRNIDVGLIEKVRDMALCRQRLSHLERVLEPPSAGSHSGSHPGLLPPSASGAALASTATLGGDQVLLPFGESNIDWAAARFVTNITGPQWARLEEVLQSLVLTPLGGLHAICQKSGDLMDQLSDPLIDQTAAFLDQILDVGDISEGNFVAGGKRADLVAMIEICHDRARPLVPGDPREESDFLIVPTSAAANELAEEVRARLPKTKILHALGQTSDIMVCREQQHLSARHLQMIAGHCREAYQELAERAGTSPHARFDVLEWLPLEI
jgi:hypothetical protein